MGDQVVSSTNHGLIISPNGKVWSYGSNQRGQLGYVTDGYSPNPRIVPGLPPIVSVSAGINNSFFLDQDGEVWGVGSNIPEIGQDSQVVQRIFIPGKVIAISSGDDHVLFLNSDGEVFGYGYKDSLGKLASLSDELAIQGNPEAPNEGNPEAPNDENYIIRPTKLKFNGFVTAISAGEEHSLILDNHGQVWYVGYEDLGDNDFMWSQFKSLPLPPIKAISAGVYHDLYLTENGRVFFTGTLDGEEIYNDQHVYATNTGLMDIKEIRAGNLLDLAVSEDGEVFVISRTRLSNDEFNPEIFSLNLDTRGKTVSNNFYNNKLLLVDEDSRVWRLNINYNAFAVDEDNGLEVDLNPLSDLVAKDPQLLVEHEEPYLSFDLIERLLKDERFSDYRVRTTFEDMTLMEFELKTGEIYQGWVKYNAPMDKLSPLDHELGSFEHLTELAKDKFPEHEFLPNLYSDERGNRALKYRDDDGKEYIIVVNVDNESIYPPL